MTESQADQDAALAKSMKRQPLERKLGESDFHYHRRLSRTLTEAQIALAHDMHAIHAAQAAGFELPPLPVSDEQKALDAERAKSLGVKPLDRLPGELDADYELRLAASEPVSAATPTPGALPRNAGETDAAYKVRNDANIAHARGAPYDPPGFVGTTGGDRHESNLPRNPGETDAAYAARNDANLARIEHDRAVRAATATPGGPPAPQPHAFGDA